MTIKSIIDATFEKTANSDIAEQSSTWASWSSLQKAFAVPVNKIFAARIGDANSAAMFTIAWFTGDCPECRVMEVAVKVPEY